MFVLCCSLSHYFLSKMSTIAPNLYSRRAGRYADAIMAVLRLCLDTSLVFTGLFVRSSSQRTPCNGFKWTIVVYPDGSVLLCGRAGSTASE